MRVGGQEMDDHGGDDSERPHAPAAGPHLKGETHASIAIGDLHDVISQLPVGITVQDQQGRFLYVNETAGAHFNLAALSTETPQLFPYAQLKRRQELCIEALRTGRGGSSEERFTGVSGEREFLSSHWPIRLADRQLLLTSMVDVTARRTR